ncbi:Crossover junction endodeoxyribonuclease RuvC [Chlamydiales bacterium SCGC AG-110-M15]|nr:Crossover junction endodeoxyribonuclease RuvC [Chlamydiales bacterium SCGC AG-110-M15]
MIVLGVDPGTRVTGYGFVLSEGRRQSLLEYGCIRTPKGASLSERYCIIYEGLEDLVARFSPDAIAVETQFMKENFNSAMKLGMARGMVLLLSAKLKIPIYEYAPTKAKRAVVGNGRASKQQVQAMIKVLLNLPVIPEPDDAADALALAICHLNAVGQRLELGTVL